MTVSQSLIPSAAAVMIPLSPAIHKWLPIDIEQKRIQSNKNYPQLASITLSKVDKIPLTNEQIKQFNNLAFQLSSGSITMEEVVL